MVTELFYLLLTVGLCGIMWIPIVIERVLRIGLAETIGSKPDEINVPSWAMRLRRSPLET